MSTMIQSLSPDAPTRSPSPSALRVENRLPGPTGIRVGNGWVQAFLKGVPIAGICFKVAEHYEDAGSRALLVMVTQFYGPETAADIVAGGVQVD